MHAKKTNKTKLAVVLLAVVLLIGCTAGATLAWLMDSTEEVVNTFTYGDINIDLTESEGNVADNDNNANTNSYKMIPGATITKDPKVTVEADSEACYLFVKVEKSANFDDFMTYEMAEGWIPLNGEGDDGIYYRLVDAATAKTGETYKILVNDQVKVLDTVTKAMLNALDAGEGAANYPTLTFTAYAVQQANGTGTFTAADAWTQAKTLIPTP